MDSQDVNTDQITDIDQSEKISGDQESPEDQIQGEDDRITGNKPESDESPQ